MPIIHPGICPDLRGHLQKISSQTPIPAVKHRLVGKVCRTVLRMNHSQRRIRREGHMLHEEKSLEIAKLGDATDPLPCGGRIEAVILRSHGPAGKCRPLG